MEPDGVSVAPAMAMDLPVPANAPEGSVWNVTLPQSQKHLQIDMKTPFYNTTFTNCTININNQ